MVVTESTIRQMTRLAQQQPGAINLSQGFPNEPPPECMRLALAHSALSGQVVVGAADDSIASKESLVAILQKNNENDDDKKQHDDVTNQYSPPMGREDVRQAVSDYYQRLYDYEGATADSVTITLGATEALASALRTVGKPGNKVTVLEPFHELYPSQCEIFYLEPVFVTLREEEENANNNMNSTGGDGSRGHSCWSYDKKEFRAALRQSRILLLNTPHNPTGKVFSQNELLEIADWCIEFDVIIITDEIYEHMVLPPPPCTKSGSGIDNNRGGAEQQAQPRHYLLPQLVPRIQDRVLICNSIGKSASATGWRFGWCITPPCFTAKYRSIHDQMVVMSPHPMQVASLVYLNLSTEYFREELPRRYFWRMFQLLNTLREAGFQIRARPQGAYYLFADYTCVEQIKAMKPMDAALYMLRTVGVACVPGDNFYRKDLAQGRRYLRFAACRSPEDINRACEKIRNIMLTKT